MTTVDPVILIHTRRKHLRKHLRKASWLLEQVRLSVVQSPEIDPSGRFAENLSDVERHLLSTCQGFFKSKPGKTIHTVKEHHATEPAAKDGRPIL